MLHSTIKPATHAEFFALSVLLITLSQSSDAGAAVRSCYPSVSSEVASAATELEAKKRALEQWQVKAARYGEGLTAWHIAVEKVIKCFPRDAAFECVAIGQPCIIEQNPKRHPVGKDRSGAPL